MSNTAVDRFEVLIQGATVIFVGNFLGMGSLFLMRLLSARYLRPGQYGLFVLGITFVNFITIVSLSGLPRGLARELPRTEYKSEIFVAAGLICIPISLILAAGTWFFAGEIERLFGQQGLLRVLAIFSFSIPFLVVSKLTIGGIRGLENTKGKILIEDISNQFSKLLGILLAIGIGLNVLGFSIVWTLGSVFAGLVSVYYVKSHSLAPPFSVCLGEVKNQIKPLFVFSLPLMVSESLWRLMKQTDNFVIGYFHPSELIGVYDASFLIARIIFFIPIAFSYLFLPQFTTLYSQDSPERTEFYQLVTQWMLLLIGPLYISIAVAPELILETVYGSEYKLGEIPLFVLSTGYVVHIVFGLNIEALTAIGETKQIMIGNLLGFLFNIVLNLILVPKYGMEGAAVASTTTFVVINGFFAYQLYNKLSVHPFSGRVKKTVLLTLTLLSVILTVPMETLLTKLLVASTAVGLLWAFGIEDEDVQIVTSVITETLEKIHKRKK